MLRCTKIASRNPPTAFIFSENKVHFQHLAHELCWFSWLFGHVSVTSCWVDLTCSLNVTWSSACPTFFQQKSSVIRRMISITLENRTVETDMVVCGCSSCLSAFSGVCWSCWHRPVEDAFSVCGFHCHRYVKSLFVLQTWLLQELLLNSFASETAHKSVFQGILKCVFKL